MKRKETSNVKYMAVYSGTYFNRNLSYSELVKDYLESFVSNYLSNHMGMKSYRINELKESSVDLILNTFKEAYKQYGHFSFVFFIKKKINLSVLMLKVKNSVTILPNILKLNIL